MRVAWQIFELLTAIVYDPRFKIAGDRMLDPVEEIFADDQRVIKACNKIRETLQIPDDDD